MNSELRTAIYDIGKVITDLGGKFYYQEAPVNVRNPYAVFTFITETESRDSASRFPEFILQINLYDTDAERLEGLIDDLRSSFDDCSDKIVLDSYYCDRFEFQNARPQKIGRVFQITLQYKIELTHK